MANCTSGSILHFNFSFILLRFSLLQKTSMKSRSSCLISQHPKYLCYATTLSKNCRVRCVWYPVRGKRQVWIDRPERSWSCICVWNFYERGMQESTGMYENPGYLQMDGWLCAAGQKQFHLQWLQRCLLSGTATWNIMHFVLQSCYRISHLKLVL